MIELKPTARIIYPKSKEAAIEMLELIEYSARNCSTSQSEMTEESYREFIATLIYAGHTSPLEHSLMTAEIVTARAVMYELTRHRHSSFSIRSQRVVDSCGANGAAFALPVFDKYDEEKAKIQLSLWRDDCLEAERRYLRMREAGATIEDARKCLTNSAATVIVMSSNLRQWREVLRLRTADNVYPECRVVMRELLKQAKVMFPGVFDGIGAPEA